MKQLDADCIVNIIGGLLFIGLVMCIYLLKPMFFSDLWHILLSRDMHETIAYIDSFGIWSVIFSFFLGVLVNALGFLPAIFFSTANAMLFGLVPGIILSWLAETIGVILSFYLMRTILRSSAEKFIDKSQNLKKIDQLSGNKGFQIMLIARAIPYIPSGLITALGAISKISARDYTLANLIGKLPSTTIEVVLLYDVMTKQENIMHLTTATALAILIYIGVWWHKKHERAVS